MRALLAAIAFLTRIPVGRALVLDGADVARGSVFFPIVGALIGAVTALVLQLGGHALPPLAAAGIAIAAAAILTGALHLDGLADAADALGGLTRERSLEIMRDSRVGSYGVVALICDLVVKAAVLSWLLTNRHLPVVIAACALSRATSVPLGLLLPYARAGEGKGRAVADGVTKWHALAALGLAAAIAVLFAGSRGVLMTLAVLAATALFGLWCRRRFGGITGDLLGANTELCELLALILGVALWR